MLEPSFAGTRRYTPTRVLGAGSWGRVYQAYDNERNAFVAVKLLQRTAPDALMRFKREFRSLQDLVHPNLVTLYELLSEHDQWFFTMELIDGKSFLHHVRGEPVASGETSPGAGAVTVNERVGAKDLDASTATLAAAALPGPAVRARERARPRQRTSAEAIARLRDALGQLIDGLSALHGAGKLHRDVKPSNVLVARDGRVVLLDFGLVHEVLEPDETVGPGLVVGTPAYMSPEQAGGLTLDEASDWYAVGVLLFETLTGQVPFEGPSTQMLKARRTEDPPRPSELADGVPADLDALCVQLLARDPAQRPKGWQLIERFKRAEPKVKLDLPLPLFGRDAELGTLAAAHAWVRERRGPAVVSLTAATGLGKSALLAQFVAELEANDPTAMVLLCHCGEREAVPFKAFDQGIDLLVAGLKSWSPDALARVLPQNVRSLMRLFPALERLAAAIPESAPEAPADPAETRRLGFLALRELLAACGRTRTVVLAIDDLHFADEDSAALLEALLKPPAPPTILAIAAFRPAEPGSPAPVAVQVIERATAGAPRVRATLCARLELSPLDERAARTLAQAHGIAERRVDEIVREAAGSPLVVSRLAALGDARPSSLHEWASRQLEALSPAARCLLEVVAVAQRPVDRLVAWHAARLDQEAADPSMQLLAARLLSTEGTRLLPYQRELGRAVRDAVPPERRTEVLAALADALEAHPDPDFECLADWALEAGQAERASAAAERAAEQAARVLAFERAARLYLRAEAGRAGADLSRVQRLRARALAAAGHGKEAAGIYLSLGAAAAGDEALALHLKAAEQLLWSGHVDEGIATLSVVLEALGERVPKSDALAKAWALVSRVRVELRSLDWRVKPERERDRAALLRTDVYWAAAKGFSLVDPVRGTAFQFVHFRHALDSGDPYRIARALALEAGFHALMGSTHCDACLHTLQLLARVLKDHPNDHAEGLAAMMAGCRALGCGHLGESVPHFEYALRLFREKCPDMTWEISSTLQYLTHALFNVGEFAAMRRHLTDVEDWAQARGDSYALTNFHVRVAPLVRLLEDDSEGAHGEIAFALQGFSRAGYFVQHLWGFLGDVAASLYAGRYDQAIARSRAEWPQILASGMLRIQFSRVQVGYLRGLLAALDPVTGVRRAAALASALEREGIDWALGLAGLVRGALAVRAGETTKAVELIGAAAPLLDACGASTHATAARRAVGVLSGAAGEVDRADAWLSQRGARRPEAFARAFFALPAT